MDEGAAELRAKLMTMEKAAIRKLGEWDDKIQETKAWTSYGPLMDALWTLYGPSMDAFMDAL